MNAVRILVLYFVMASSKSIEKSAFSETSFLSRTIRNDKAWIWPDDIKQNNTTNIGSEHPTSTPNTVENNPCESSNPLKPDFKAPGRRISEIKCIEYTWKKKNLYNKIQEYPRVLRPEVDIIGGRDGEQGEFPYMGALGWRSVRETWIFKCGASLISSKFMLTAAHCSKIPIDTNVVSRDPEIVRLGVSNIIDVSGEAPVDAKILKLIVHPKYASPKRYYDIALIELVDKLEFTSNLQPACLWNDFNTSSLGTSASVAGWGLVEAVSLIISPTLKAAEVDIINSELCNELLKPSCNRKWCGIEENQICAGKLAGGVDACKGDSGGPLQVELLLSHSPEVTLHMVIGVTSFGFGCARPNVPGVYTRVSSFIDWIESIVWPSDHKSLQ